MTDENVDCWCVKHVYSPVHISWNVFTQQLLIMQSHSLPLPHSLSLSFYTIDHVIAIHRSTTWLLMDRMTSVPTWTWTRTRSWRQNHVMDAVYLSSFARTESCQHLIYKYKYIYIYIYMGELVYDVDKITRKKARKSGLYLNGLISSAIDKRTRNDSHLIACHAGGRGNVCWNTTVVLYNVRTHRRPSWRVWFMSIDRHNRMVHESVGVLTLRCVARY